MFECTMMSKVYQKEIYRLPLPRELLREILTYCDWTFMRTAFWYIVASKFDPSSLYRAKQMDDAYHYLASDDNDVHTVFHRYHPKHRDIDAYVNHIERNYYL